MRFKTGVAMLVAAVFMVPAMAGAAYQVRGPVSQIRAGIAKRIQADNSFHLKSVNPAKVRYSTLSTVKPPSGRMGGATVSTVKASYDNMVKGLFKVSKIAGTAPNNSIKVETIRYLMVPRSLPTAN